MPELPVELRRLSGTTLDATGAANAWAGTSGLALLGALNAKAGTHGLGLNGVLNALAGTTGLGPNAAATAISGVVDDGSFDVTFTSLSALPAGWTDQNPGTPVTVNSNGLYRPGGSLNGEWVKGPNIVGGVGTLTVRVSGSTATPIWFWRNVAGTAGTWIAKMSQIIHTGGPTGTVNQAYTTSGSSLKVVMATGGVISIYAGAPGSETFVYTRTDANWNSGWIEWGLQVDDPTARIVRAIYTTT